MFNRIANTWTVMGESWDVLQKHKQLLLFPILSGIGSLLVMASFIIPIFLTNSWQPPARTAPPQQQFAYYGVLFAFYVCNYFVIIFFNAATTACAARSLRGEPATLGDGLRDAASCVHWILGWALVSATVGLVLHAIEERSEKVGRFVVSLLGMAWTVVTYLVVPILVIDRKGPLAALKDSARLVEDTWGEQVVGGLSFGVLNFLFLLPAVLIAMFAFLTVATQNVIFLGVLFGVAVVWFTTVVLITSVLQNIFRTALYLYVRHGQVAGFSNDLLAGAMQQRP